MHSWFACGIMSSLTSAAGTNRTVRIIVRMLDLKATLAQECSIEEDHMFRIKSRAVNN